MRAPPLPPWIRPCYCSEYNSLKMEKIKERAPMFIYEDYNSSYENLLEKSKLPSLKIRRLKSNE